MSAEAVRVAVRVRPFNQREKDRDAKCIIRMSDGTKTTIINPATDEEKDFAFDFSYWSHDGFDTLDDGYNAPSETTKSAFGAEYSGQKEVYQSLGRGVLNNALDGYNCCLFAYGQTGSGKSYSFVGYGANKGIVPQVCDEVFKRKTEIEAGGCTKLQVTFSMLEIYNEKIRDLLNTNPKTNNDLQVRTTPKGTYVQGATAHAVGSFTEIEKTMDLGTASRTVAATQMNATSSRAHTVMCITVAQVTSEGGRNKELKSDMNLVDLAGSERAESTGATGDRLKEGAAINKSLSALGNVISALADRANKPDKKVFVPYRDSKLTQILQSALGGNSKTIMVAALSPADINFEETLSTLRYADRAKQIKVLVEVQENPTDKLIRQLREENAKLQAALGGSGAVLTSPDAAAAGTVTEEDMQAAIEAAVAKCKQASAEEKAAALEAMERELNARQEARATGKLPLSDVEGIIRSVIDGLDDVTAEQRETAKNAALDALAELTGSKGQSAGKLCPEDCQTLVCETLATWGTSSTATDEELQAAKETAKALLAPDAKVWDDGVLDESELLEVMEEVASKLASVDAEGRKQAIAAVRFQYAYAREASLGELVSLEATGKCISVGLATIGDLDLNVVDLEGSQGGVAALLEKAMASADFHFARRQRATQAGVVDELAAKATLAKAMAAINSASEKQRKAAEDAGSAELQKQLASAGDAAEAEKLRLVEQLTANEAKLAEISTDWETRLAQSQNDLQQMEAAVKQMEKELEKALSDAKVASARHEREQRAMAQQLDAAVAKASALEKLGQRVGESDSLGSLLAILLASIVLGLDASSNLESGNRGLMALGAVSGSAASAVLAIGLITFGLIVGDGENGLKRPLCALCCRGLQLTPGVFLAFVLFMGWSAAIVAFTFEGRFLPLISPAYFACWSGFVLSVNLVSTYAVVKRSSQVTPAGSDMPRLPHVTTGPSLWRLALCAIILAMSCLNYGLLGAKPKPPPPSMEEILFELAFDPDNNGVPPEYYELDICGPNGDQPCDRIYNSTDPKMLERVFGVSNAAALGLLSTAKCGPNGDALCTSANRTWIRPPTLNRPGTVYGTFGCGAKGDQPCDVGKPDSDIVYICGPNGDEACPPGWDSYEYLYYDGEGPPDYYPDYTDSYPDYMDSYEPGSGGSSPSTSRHKVETEFKLSGSVSDYSEASQSAIKTVLADEADVNTDSVTLELTAGSVIVAANIFFGTETGASAAADRLSDGVLADATSLETALNAKFDAMALGLSIAVQQIRAPRVISRPRPNNGNNPNYGNQNNGNQNYGNQNYGNQNYGNQNYGNQNSGNQNYGNQNSGNQNYGNQNYGNQNYGGNQNNPSTSPQPYGDDTNDYTYPGEPYPSPRPAADGACGTYTCGYSGSGPCPPCGECGSNTCGPYYDDPCPPCYACGTNTCGLKGNKPCPPCNYQRRSPPRPPSPRQKNRPVPPSSSPYTRRRTDASNRRALSKKSVAAPPKPPRPMPPPPPSPDGTRERTQPYRYGGWGMRVLPQLIYGVFSSLVTLILICVMLCWNSIRCARQVIALTLVILWISAASFLTFRPPFTYTGNGFFACWCGVLQSVQILYREVIPSSTSYERLAAAGKTAAV